MYYTIRLRDLEKQIWDVVKYTNTQEIGLLTLIAGKYTYAKGETIKSSLSYNDADNLATILNKLKVK